jgi:hypothetical protein
MLTFLAFRPLRQISTLFRNVGKFYQTTLSHTPKRSTPHSHRHENLRFNNLRIRLPALKWSILFASFAYYT